MALNNDEYSECEKFLKLISLLLDNEASEEEEHYISQHMDDCSPCFQKLKTEKEYRDLLRAKVGKVEVPADLVNAIKTKIKSLV